MDFVWGAAAPAPGIGPDTFTHLQKPANPNAVWEIAVPNGTYTVVSSSATRATRTVSTA